jgi:uncharacterized surface protein with fasciclin (FAS1) repeats
MRRRDVFRLGAFGLASTCLAACGRGGAPRPAPRSGGGVLAAARANGAGRFAHAASAAELADLLDGAGPFTLFAPTDAAFGAAGGGRLGGEELRRFVAYHVVPGQLTTDFLEGRAVNHTTLLGSSLNVDGTGGELRVNGARVVRADRLAANGVVFTLDRALEPR